MNKNNALKSKAIVIVSHKHLTLPDDDLVIFLRNNKIPNVLHIRHSFSDAKDRCSFYTWYKYGELFEEYRTYDFHKLPEIFIYFKELYFTTKWIFQSKLVYDVYIGMDGLCVLFGELLKKIGRVKKTVYFVMDFVPKGRFASKLKDSIYHWVNNKAVRQSDEVWDDMGGERLELREKMFGIKISDYKKHIIVPYGVWLEKTPKFSFNNSERNVLVFMGHITKRQGLQFVIKSIPEIIKKIPDFKFKIIGGGNYESELKKLIAKNNLNKYCIFLGKMKDYNLLLNEIAKSAAAIAPYSEEKDNFSYYGDNGKVKTYLSCGVPVLLTNVSWIAPEIEKNNCGKIITNEPKNIAHATINILNNADLNTKQRENAILFARNFDNNQIFYKLYL